MIHRLDKHAARVVNVVNCFQNPILEDDSQGHIGSHCSTTGCELLSESYFRG